MKPWLNRRGVEVKSQIPGTSMARNNLHPFERAIRLGSQGNYSLPNPFHSDKVMNEASLEHTISTLDKFNSVLPKGILSPAVAEYFNRFFPSRLRVTSSEFDDGYLVLPRNEFIPACLAASPNERFSQNAAVSFSKPVSKEAEYVRGSSPPFKLLHGGQSFRQETSTSLILTLFPKATSTRLPFEALLNDNSCDGKVCAMKVVASLPKDFVSTKHLWSSGGSVRDHSGRLHYLSHANMYDVKYHVKDGGNDFKLINISGFDGLGGEYWIPLFTQ